MSLPEKYAAVIRDLGCAVTTKLQEDVLMLLFGNKYGLHTVAIQKKLKQSSSAITECLNALKECKLVEFEKVSFAMLMPGRTPKTQMIALKDDAWLIDNEDVRQLFKKGSRIRRPKTGEYLVTHTGFTVPIKENPSAGGAISVTVYRIKEEILKELLD